MNKNIIKLFSILLFLAACTASKSNIDNKTGYTASIHDIWSLTAMESQAIDPSTFIEIPNIEFNLTENTFAGSDGCNSYSGEIKKIGKKELILGNMSSTEMYCGKMEATDLYNSLLLKVVAFKRDAMKLHLLDKDNKLLLSFNKVD